MNTLDQPLPAARPLPWRRSLLVILSIAFLTRLAVLLHTLHTKPHNWLYTKGIEMGLLADALVHGLGYSSPFGVPTGPTAFIAPGYPTLVAAVFRLFGSYSYTSAIVIMSVQVLLCVGTIYLMMHVCREALDARTAILAGAFWAIAPPVLYMPTIFWETSISACALPGMIALLLHTRKNPTRAKWLLLGTYIAVIGLINPALLPSLLAMLGWLAWQTRSISKTAPILSLVALTIVFAAWPIRNAVRFHAFIPLRSTVGFELWMGNRPGATGFLDVDLFPAYDKHELANYVSMGEVAYTHDKSQQAWSYVRAYPGIFVKMTARRIFRFWTGTGGPGLSPIWEIHSVTTTLLGFAGLILIYFRRTRTLAILFLLPILLFPVPYYITHAEFRYRLNIDPVMTILGAFAITQLDSAMARRAAVKATRKLSAPVAD
ncbi:MAG TPA: glycosyltransferase family 39 protein [Acidobacteriaceae bacterium]